MKLQPHVNDIMTVMSYTDVQCLKPRHATGEAEHTGLLPVYTVKSASADSIVAIFMI